MAGEPGTGESTTLLSEVDAGKGDAGAADKAAADAKAAADKTAADTKAAADAKTAADAKAAQEAADAKLTPEERAAKKTADDKAAADKAEADKKAAAQKAPEKYEPFKTPEGVKLDEKLSTKLQAVAKELNLTQEQAQKLADLGVEHGQLLQDTLKSELTKAAAGWAEQSRADKEFGGDKFDENLGVAKKGFAQFGTPELGKLLKESGLGNHPEVLRMNYRIGKALADDKFVQGRDGTGSSKSIEDRLYGAKS